MGLSLTFRAARPDDVAALARLLDQLNRVEGKEHATDAQALGHALFERERKVPLIAMVAELDERLVGVVFYYPGYDVLTTSHGYHLSDFVVDEGVRKQGIGKLLFVHLARQNLSEGGQWISLTVLKKNEAARGFYKKLGMVHVEVDFFAIGARGLTALVQSVA